MTPGARLQAAIDILTTIAETRHPADRVFDGWARSSRFAGSKDRAAVSERVYLVLRHRAELSAALGSDSPRLLALGSVALLDQAGVAAAMALADGARHAPAPLAPDEAASLKQAQLPDGDAPLSVRLNYPDWLHGEFERAFGGRLEAEMSALMERAPTDLRVNLLKTTRDEARAGLAEEKVETEATPLSPWGLRLSGRGNIPGLKTFRDGLVEVQDEGSQIACLLAGAKPGEQVVDLCAGGGGKSLALAALMGNRGQIHACDTDRRRLGRLMPRAQRAGARNIQTRFIKPHILPGGPDPDLADLEGKADCVLVDAPCSGTGAWRRSPDARWNLTPEMLAGYRVTQAEVMARGARLVRPGGRLVYVTCSLLPGENEDQVAAFLAARSDYEEAAWRDLWPEELPPPSGGEAAALRLSPASTGTDGFFVAILRRRA